MAMVAFGVYGCLVVRLAPLVGSWFLLVCLFLGFLVSWFLPCSPKQCLKAYGPSQSSRDEKRTSVHGSFVDLEFMCCSLKGSRVEVLVPFALGESAKAREDPWPSTTRETGEIRWSCCRCSGPRAVGLACASVSEGASLGRSASVSSFIRKGSGFKPVPGTAPSLSESEVKSSSGRPKSCNFTSTTGGSDSLRTGNAFAAPNSSSTVAAAPGGQLGHGTHAGRGLRQRIPISPISRVGRPPSKPNPKKELPNNGKTHPHLFLLVST